MDGAITIGWMQDRIRELEAALAKVTAERDDAVGFWRGFRENPVFKRFFPESHAQVGLYLARLNGVAMSCGTPDRSLIPCIFSDPDECVDIDCDHNLSRIDARKGGDNG